MNSKCEALRAIVAAIKPTVRPSLEVHRWWARRYPELTRGMIISALASPVEGIEQMTADATDLGGAVVLDPFSGSGTTVIEALRLGCLPIGIDLNPMAWWIMRNRLLPIDLDASDAAVEAVYSTCVAQTGHLYQTKCPHCSVPLPARAFVWVMVSQCHTCGHTVRLMPSAQIASTSHLSVLGCPTCGQLSITGGKAQVECPSCQQILSKRTSTYQRGKVICLRCDGVQPIANEVAQIGRPLPREMLMIEATCPEHGLVFKMPEEDDLALVERASSLLEDSGPELPLPTASIDHDFSPTDLRTHGLQKHTDFFNVRQLLTLGILLKAISSIEQDDIQSTLLTVFSGMLEYNSILCRYSSHAGRVMPLFASHLLVPAILSAEANPWHEGSIGGWKNRYRRVVRAAKEQLTEDPAPRIRGRTQGWPQITFVSEVSDLKQGTVLLACTSADDLPLPDNSVDAIVTDPPFFDSVQYAFLSDFFYAWVAPVLAHQQKAFSTPLTPKTSEIVVHPRSKGNQVERYENSLRVSFIEFGRVLKQDAPLVFIYRVPSLESLKLTLQWILDAGLFLSDFCRMEPDHKPAFRQSVKEKTFATQAIFYCYKRGSSYPIGWQPFQEDLARHLNTALNELQNADHEGLIEAVWGEFIRRFSISYPHIHHSDGTCVSVDQAVDWMQSLAAVVSDPKIDLSKMDGTQRIRKAVTLGGGSEEELDEAADQIAGLMEETVPGNDERLVERDLILRLGRDLWNRLEFGTQCFLKTAEFHYHASAGKDIDFGATAVAYTKPLETELRCKFCRHLARYARVEHLDEQSPRAGKRTLKWQDLAEGKVTLGPIEHVLRNLGLSANAAVASYLGNLPFEVADYARNILPTVVREFREDGRNRGAHIDPVGQEVVDRLRSIVLDREGHLKYWAEL